MEIITNTHGEGRLATKVCFSDENAICVASVIIMGKKDCILIDCQWTLSNAHRVIAEIIETGLTLKAIFITHAHPDHYWGLGLMEQAFPDAKCYMTPEDYKIYQHQYQDKLDEWEALIGTNNLCRRQAENVLEFTGDALELDGERIEIIHHIMGDIKWNAAVWIPSIKTLYGSDILFNQTHPFTCEVTPAQRLEWIKSIDRLSEMGAEVVIPGHKSPGVPLDDSTFKFIKDYLIATDEEIANTTDASGFFYNMVRRFPHANLVWFSDEMNAEVYKGGRQWDWSED